MTRLKGSAPVLRFLGMRYGDGREQAVNKKMAFYRVRAEGVQLLELVNDQKHAVVGRGFPGSVYGKVLYSEAARPEHFGQLGGLDQPVNFAHIGFQYRNEGGGKSLEGVVARAERSHCPTAELCTAQLGYETGVYGGGFAAAGRPDHHDQRFTLHVYGIKQLACECLAPIEVGRIFFAEGK